MTRARPILEGTLGGIYDFRFTPDFGQGKTVIQDAYITARFRPEFQVTAGKFKSPVGLERLQSANDIRFVARGVPDAARAEPRHRPAGRRRPVRRPASATPVAYLNGRNDGGSSDTFGDRPGPEQRQGMGGAPVRAAVRRERQLRAARPRHRHRRRPTRTRTAPRRRRCCRPTARRHRRPFFRYRTGTTRDDRGRRAHAPRAAALLLRRQLRAARRVHARSQDVSRLRRPAYREGTMDTYAWQLTASLVPDRRGGIVPGLQAELGVLAGQGHLGRVGTRRALP